MSGTLALVGGAPFTEGCTFDRRLLDTSGASEVAVLPTGSAYERPHLLVEAAAAWFEGLGVSVRDVPVLTRSDARDPANAAMVGDADFIYVVGSSPMHLRSVLKDTPTWEALVASFERGAVVAGANAGADVLCDPMVDVRGGAFTVGLGLIDGVSVMPRIDEWSHDTLHRTVAMAPAGLVLAGVPSATALVRDPDGSWWTDGVGEVVVHVDGASSDLAALPG